MELVLNSAKLDRITFEVGDIVVWHNSPYVVLERPTFCLASLNGDALACAKHESLESLINRVNQIAKYNKDNVRVFSKEDYILNLERKVK